MKDPICPFLKKACIEHDCMMWTHVTMTNPQTGLAVDNYSCAIAWLPTLLIENSSQGRKVAASVDSMRNEVVQRQDTLNSAIAIASQGRNGERREKDLGDFGSSNSALPGMREHWQRALGKE